MPDGKYVFLDFDDTINDPFRLMAQYARQIGALMAPRYGGEPEAWAKCAIDMLSALEDDYIVRFYRNPLSGYCAWLDSLRLRSVEMLFEPMGLPLPENPKEFARETQREAFAACDATYPGAQAALSTLDAKGYEIYMTSGQESEYLRAALTGAGLVQFTRKWFGPDLIDCAKEGPEYYARIFAATGVAPANTVIVEDQPDVIAWALQTGAKVIQARVSPERHFPPVSGVDSVMTDVHDLPSLVDTVLSPR